MLNLPVKQGALVQTVVPDGPADKAGVKGGNATVSINGQQIRAGGDVITAIDGKPVTGMDDVINVVNQKQPGDDVAAQPVPRRPAAHRHGDPGQPPR